MHSTHISSHTPSRTQTNTHLHTDTHTHTNTHKHTQLQTHTRTPIHTQQKGFALISMPCSYQRPPYSCLYLVRISDERCYWWRFRSPRLHEPSCHMPSHHIHHASTVPCGPGVPMHLHVIRIVRMYGIQLYASNTSPVCLRCHHAHASTHMPTDHNRARCTFVSPNPGTPV